MNKKAHHEFFCELRELMDKHKCNIDINITHWDEVKGFNFNFADGGFYYCGCGYDLYVFDLEDMIEESA